MNISKHSFHQFEKFLLNSKMTFLSETLKWLPFFSSTEVTALPQYDAKNAIERQREIVSQKEKYRWTTDGIGDASFIDGLPRDEFPELGWVEKMIQTYIRISINRAAVAFDEGTEEFREAKENALSQLAVLSKNLFGKLLQGRCDREDIKETVNELSSMIRGTVTGRGCRLQEYKDHFRVLKPDKVAFQNQFMRDDVFGWYRVAGPNPMRIKKLGGKVKELFPELTDETLRGIQSFAFDSIEELEAENRVFYVDYSDFADIPQGKWIDGTPKDNVYLYSPTALFGVPKELNGRTTVLPLAIRCGQGREKYPMYTPNSKHTDHVTWQAAKLTVQIADAIAFEVIYHLGRVHLLLEVFVCSMNRCLAMNHPLKKLLKVHLYGTAFINYLAVETLVSPGGPIDLTTAPQIETINLIASRSITQPSFQFNDWFPEKEMARRGVLDAQQLSFPYRDDSLKLWKAIQDWVGCYVREYYKSDVDVKNDRELSDWCHDIVNPQAGNLHGFGETAEGQIQTVSYLVKMVSMVVFTATVQHSSVNFSQSKYMQFVPAMPMGGYTPAPMTPKPFQDIDHWIEEMLPDLDKAMMQMETAELIGVMRYTRLGEYGKDLGYLPDNVEAGLQRFQQELSSISVEIEARNRQEQLVGLPVYDVLLPKNIPQSTNI